MNYEVGKQYEMKVVDIRVDSAGYNYIALRDDESEYRVYNILKCQYENLPDTLYVVLKDIDPFGKLKFRQDEGRLNQEHYIVGKYYAFEVTDVKEDFNSKAPYYVIEDDFTSHRFYFKGERKYHIGDDCILEVEGVTDKGFLKLKEVVRPESVEVEPAVTKPEDISTQEKHSNIWTDLPVLDVEEGQNVELKTSIVFTPGTGIADIDKQLSAIVRELAAFMNADGGTLYIGVHDKTKKVIGIAEDYEHLNEGNDDFNGSYNKNPDGYQLKIRNAMDQMLPALANSLTNILFDTLGDKIFCKIEVRPSPRPIFMKGTLLYVRQGNRVKQLKGEDITIFIYRRMTISLREVLDPDDLPVSNNGLDLDTIVKAIKDIINERSYIPKDLPKPKDLDEVDYWIIWYTDGTWKHSKNKSAENDVYMQIPVSNNMSDPILAFCYATGRVSTIKLLDFKRGTRRNVRNRNGWSRTGDRPEDIFLMHATDYIVGYSVDTNGIESVKLHSISDFIPTDTPTNKGALFIPTTSQIIKFATIGSEHKKHLAHLIVPKTRRSNDVGTPLSSRRFSDELEYLQKLFG